MRRRARIILVLAFVFGMVGVPVVADFVTDTEPVGGEIPITAGSGPTVIVTGATQTELSDFSPDPNTVDVESDAGNITLRSSGNAYVRLDDYDNGTWTNVSQLDVSTYELQVAPADKQTVNVSGQTNSLAITAMEPDDGTVDFVYNGSSGSTTLTIYDVEPDKKVLAVDTDTDQVLDVATPDANDRLTLTMPNSEHSVELLTTKGDPELSNPAPVGDQSDFPTQLSVNVTDPDFPNDNVTVEFHLDGTKVGEKTTKSAGEVSLSISKPSRGNHDVRVVATDSYDESTEKNWTFGVPNTIYVRNVSNTSELVDNQTVTFTFYQRDDNVTTRTSSDGSVNLTDLDIEGDIVVTVEAPGTTAEPAYHTRTYIIQDLSEQDTVYLLPKSKTSVYNVFQLLDKSGDFDPSESNLIIKRALNVSGTTEWEAVAGGSFGAVNEIKVDLRHEARYRLVVENPRTDQQRVIGDYVAADEDNPKVITLKSIVIEPPEGQQQYGTTWLADPTEGDGKKTLWFSYNDTTESTAELSIVIHERGNPDNVLTELSPDDPGQTYTYSQTLTGDELNKTWMVDWEATDSSGNVLRSGEVPVGNRGTLPIPMDSDWLARFAIIALPIVAALSSERIATYGAMGTTAFAGVLMISGIWKIPFVLWLGAAVISVGGHAFVMASRGSRYG